MAKKKAAKKVVRPGVAKAAKPDKPAKVANPDRAATKRPGHKELPEDTRRALVKLGAEICRVRESAKLSVDDLAGLTSISRTCLFDYEAGNVPMLAIYRLAQIDKGIGAKGELVRFASTLKWV